MKAIRIDAPFMIGAVEIDAPIAAAGRAVVEVEAMGVCGSDGHAYAGKSPNVSYPVIIGHETAGVVVDVEAGNEFGVQKGDRVVLDPYLYCGVCYPCSQGKTNCCESLKCLGVQTDGSMSEYVAHPVAQLVKAPRGMSWESLAVVEPLVIALHALHRCGAKSGEHIAVIGAGAIGMLVGMAALAYEAIPILIDIVDERLETARKFGIRHVVNPSSADAVREVRAITGGRMAECVVEASGSPAGVRSALHCAAYTGRIALTGWPNKEIELPTALITRKELCVYGSRTGVRSEFVESMDLIASGDVPAENIISRVVDFEGLPDAVRSLHEAPGDCLKAIALKR